MCRSDHHGRRTDIIGMAGISSTSQVSIRSAWVIRCVSGLQSKDGAIVHTKAEDATQHESGLRGHNGWRRKNDERKGFGRAPRISIPAIRTCQSGRTSERVKTYPHTSIKKIIPVVVVD